MKITEEIRERILNKSNVDCWIIDLENKTLEIGDSASNMLGIDTVIPLWYFKKLIKKEFAGFFEKDAEVFLYGELRWIEFIVDTPVQRNITVRAKCVSREENDNGHHCLSGFFWLTPESVKHPAIDPRPLASSFREFLDNKDTKLIIESILETTQKVYNVDTVAIFKYDFDNQKRSCLFEYSKSGVDVITRLSKSSDYSANDSFVAARIRMKKPVIISSLNDYPLEYPGGRDELKSENIHSILCVPIITDGKVFGSLIMFVIGRRRVWNTEEFNLFSATASLISMCLRLKFSADEVKNLALHDQIWNEHKIRSVFDNIPLGIIMYDKKGDIISCNDKYLEIFNIPFKDVKSKINFIKNPLYPKYLKDTVIEGGKVDLEFKYNPQSLSEYYGIPLPNVNKDITIKGGAVLNSDKKLIFYLFTVSDNTRTDMNLFQNKEFISLFSYISSYAKIGYAKFSLTKKNGFAVDQWFENLGIEPSDNFDFQNIYRRILPDYQNILDNAIDSLSTINGTERFSSDVGVVGKDGEVKWIHGDAIVNKTKEGNIEVFEINFDQTEIKNYAKALIEARKQEEVSSRMKSAFLANMSHEIRTPLNAIVGFSNVLTYTEDPEEKQQCLKIIENNNSLLLQLISDILDLSNIDSGILEIHPTLTDVNDLLWETVKSSKLRNKNEDVKINFIQSIPHCVIYSDRNRISQVIYNFINNAMKFTHSGHINVGCKLNNNNDLYFYVSDSGCGISQKDLPSVFDRFVKLNSFVPGTGLGLAISRSIVIKLGGEIGVDSVVGKGSTFWFTMPYEPIIT